MSAKLFVGGIAWATTEDTLKSHFAQAGTVVSANIITDKYSGRSRGFGFVEMETEEEAQKAIETLNGQPLDGRPLVVNLAKPQEPRENGGGGGYRGGNGGGDRGGFRRSDRGGRGGR